LPSQIIQISVEAREKLYRDRIETMTLDNSSLQRRLKHVSEDLERLRKEKDELTK
jgi:ABC-type phosphate transport system auxiliary subunit